MIYDILTSLRKGGIDFGHEIFQALVSTSEIKTGEGGKGVSHASSGAPGVGFLLDCDESKVGNGNQ